MTRRSLWLRAYPAVLLMIVGMLAQPATAIAAGGTGHITGRVTDGAAPLQAVYVAACTAQGAGWEAVGSALTRADGSYDIGGLATGTYRVEFCLDGWPDSRVQFFSGKHDFTEATPVAVVTGRSVSRIDAIMRNARGTIAGTITDGTRGLQGIVVTPIQSTGVGIWEGVTSTVTAADGTYAIPGLTESAYRVQFFDPSGTYPAQNHRGPDGRDYVGLDPGTTVTVNATMKAVGHLTGRVTDGAAGLLVDVNAWTADGAGGWTWVAGTRTDASGAFRLGLAAPDTYRIEFVDQSRRYPYTVFPDACDLIHGADVAIAPGGENDLGAVTLPSAGHITGRVRSAASLLDWVTVMVHRADGHGGWTWVDDYYTALDGTFDVGGLRAGSYRLAFLDPARLFATQVYQGVDTTSTLPPGYETLFAGADIEVAAGAVSPGIDATLSPMTYRVGALLACSVDIRSDRASSRPYRPFVLSGAVRPGRRGDLVSVEVMKPGSARWSYSSARLCYATTQTGAALWWYRYTPKLVGSYRFRTRFGGAGSRFASLSRVISVAIR